MKRIIENCIKESISVKSEILNSQTIIKNIQLIVLKAIEAYKNDRKILLCGNGGSAADAQHIAAELSGRFYKDRKPLFAEALHVNTSFITAVANDYGYDNIYSRMVESVGREGDILIGISTSGNSKNVKNALRKANDIGMITIGFTGSNITDMDELSNIMIKIPSNVTPRIQESHILIGHVICELIEENLF